MIRPPRLRSGDRLALVAPASPFRREDFEAGVAELTRLGFEPTYDDRVFQAAGYVAGPPEVRAAALHDAWRDPSVRGIVAVRGGYGSAQLLPWIEEGLVQRAPKVFVGYSDITTLLWYHQREGLVAFHGPMIEGRLAKGTAGYERRTFLEATTVAEPMGELAPETLETLWPGEASGPLVGGTLTQLVALLGTPWTFAPPDGCILFLEDVAERPYRLDRMFTQLALAGVLRHAAGIVFGVFPGCDEADGRVRAREVLRHLTKPLAIPVLFGFPSGHTPEATWTLPLGVRARVRAGATAALVIEEAAVV